MESAGTDPMKSVLEKQGMLLGRHQSQFEAIERSLEALTASVTDMSAQLQHVQLAQTAQPQPLATQAVQLPAVIREPRLPPPVPYAGDPGTCRSFLSQCSLVFELQPSTFPSDRSRIAYVITLLTGRAREWGTAIWDSNSSVCHSFETFADEMRKVFDRSLHGREAAREMLMIRQGRRSASDYAIDFRTLAATTGWNEEAQYDAFLSGLSEAIKDEVASRELPTSFDSLVELAIRIDKRLKLHYGEREFSRRPKKLPETPLLALASPSADPEPEPMQVDRARLSPAERQRRRDSNACLYCGQPGHYLAQCPVKGSAHP